MQSDIDNMSSKSSVESDSEVSIEHNLEVSDLESIASDLATMSLFFALTKTLVTLKWNMTFTKANMPRLLCMKIVTPLFFKC